MISLKDVLAEGTPVTRSFGKKIFYSISNNIELSSEPNHRTPLLHHSLWAEHVSAMMHLWPRCQNWYFSISCQRQFPNLSSFIRLIKHLDVSPTIDYVMLNKKQSQLKEFSAFFCWPCADFVSSHYAKTCHATLRACGDVTIWFTFFKHYLIVSRSSDYGQRALK